MPSLVLLLLLLDTKTNLRKSDVDSQIFLEGKTTCRDGSKCSSDKDCKKRGLNGNCKERDGEHVEPQMFLEKRTTCRDGSKCSSDKDCEKRGLKVNCKERDGTMPKLSFEDA
ncbi:hypothetical protein ACHAWO_005666 [Cyclotella atomus]|uniref:Uncharacterized protein n=1 Tax=Cyclotella atomus TaxID=382360 RepID=A0ABD3QPX7_9STRA